MNFILLALALIACLHARAEYKEAQATEKVADACFETLCDCDDFFNSINGDTCSKLFVSDVCKWENDRCVAHERVRGASMYTPEYTCSKYTKKQSCIQDARLNICTWQDRAYCRYQARFRQERAQVRCFSCSNAPLAPKFTSRGSCRRYMKRNRGKCSETGKIIDDDDDDDDDE